MYHVFTERLFYKVKWGTEPPTLFGSLPFAQNWILTVSPEWSSETCQCKDTRICVWYTHQNKKWQERLEDAFMLLNLQCKKKNPDIQKIIFKVTCFRIPNSDLHCRFLAKLGIPIKLQFHENSPHCGSNSVDEQIFIFSCSCNFLRPSLTYLRICLNCIVSHNLKCLNV